jgi:hypothetical protein
MVNKGSQKNHTARHTWQKDVSADFEGAQKMKMILQRQALIPGQVASLQPASTSFYFSYTFRATTGHKLIAPAWNNCSLTSHLISQFFQGNHHDKVYPGSFAFISKPHWWPQKSPTSSPTLEAHLLLGHLRCVGIFHSLIKGVRMSSAGSDSCSCLVCQLPATQSFCWILLGRRFESWLSVTLALTGDTGWLLSFHKNN